MTNPFPRLFFVAFLCLFAVRLFGQAPSVSRPRPVLSTVSVSSGSLAQKFIELNGDVLSRARNYSPVGRPIPRATQTRISAHTLVATNPPVRVSAKAAAAQPHGAIPLNAPACNDTAGHILTTETNDLLAPDFITLTRDGNILVPGFRFTLNTPYHNYPYLMKQTPQGGIVWARSFTGFVVPPNNTADCYKCFELRDGTLILVGDLDIPEPVNGSRELVIWHLDANGNVLWRQTDSSTLWQQNAGSFNVSDMTQDQAGNIFLAGNLYALGAYSSHTFVLKMDGSGNIQWDQSFPAGMSQCYGLFWTGNQLSMVGTNYDSDNSAYLWNMKLDPATGFMLSKKGWQGMPSV